MPIGTLADMAAPFLGSEAIASGRLTPYQLRSRFLAIYPDVYVHRDAQLSAAGRARAAWLWSRRRAVVAGQSAAAVFGAKWVEARRPAELLWANRRPPKGIRNWSDSLAEHEIQVVGGMTVTTPARTALDLACRYPEDSAVAAIDALARSTRLRPADVEALAERYPGRRGIRSARRVLELIDGGAESPRETWLRLLLVRAGFPRPQTQISIHDEFGCRVAVADLGWESIKLAVDYEGEHHRIDRRRFNHDIRRSESIIGLGWIHLRFTVEDPPGSIVSRVRSVWGRRT